MTQNFCESCGWTLENATKFCVHCGERIKTPPKMGAFEKALTGKPKTNIEFMKSEWKIAIVIFVPIVIIFGSYFISDSFEQTSGKSFGMSVTNFVSILVGAFLVLIIPALIVLGLLKRDGRLSGKSLKNILKGLGLLFLGLVVVGVVSTFFWSDEEELANQKERTDRERQELLERIAQKEERDYNEKYADEIRLGIDPKSIEDLEGLELQFGNEWDDLEKLIEQQRSGEITFNQECQIIANLMNQNISDDYLYTFWHEAFLQECT